MQESRIIKSTLDELLKEADSVFIVPHNYIQVPDFDGIGASIGMSLICKKNKKNNYIVLGDSYDRIDTESLKEINEIKEKYPVIKTSDIQSLITNKSLLILVDVSNKDLISVKNYLDLFDNIFILDHHEVREDKVIQTPYSFIDPKLSSTCEEVSRLLFINNIKITPEEATYLYAGICLDTNNFKQNIDTYGSTHNVGAKLVAKGANISKVNNMFSDDFEHDREIHRLIDNAIFPTYIYAIASDTDDEKIYNIEDIAKAADYLLNYKNISASFVIAKSDKDTVSISARSKGNINVSKIMNLFGGGGKTCAAAARIKNANITEIKDKLNWLLNPVNVMDYNNLNIESNNQQMVLSLTNK